MCPGVPHTKSSSRSFTSCFSLMPNSVGEAGPGTGADDRAAGLLRRDQGGHLVAEVEAGGHRDLARRPDGPHLAGDPREAEDAGRAPGAGVAPHRTTAR